MCSVTTNQITLSILIPAYNYFEGFRRTFESLYVDNKKIEYIVSDDSESDMIKNYMSRLDKRNITYVKNTPALGAVKNWNSLISNASGEYVWICHHDEYLEEPSDIQQIIQHLAKSDTEVIILRTIIQFSNSFKLPHFPSFFVKWCLNYDHSFITRKNYIGPMSTIIVKKNICRRFDDKLRWFVDVIWYLEILEKYPKILFLPDIYISSVQNNPYSITKEIENDLTKIKNYEKYLIRRRSKFRPSTVISYFMWIVSSAYRRWGSFINGR